MLELPASGWIARPAVPLGPASASWHGHDASINKLCPRDQRGMAMLAGSALNTTKSETLSPWLGAACPVALLDISSAHSASDVRSGSQPGMQPSRALLPALTKLSSSSTNTHGLLPQARVPDRQEKGSKVPEDSMTAPGPVCVLAAPFLSIKMAGKFATLELGRGQGQVDPRTSVTHNMELIVQVFGSLAVSINVQYCLHQMCRQSRLVLSV